MPDRLDAVSRVAVITVAYASDDVLPAFLQSVSGSTDRPTTVIVADNKPEDGVIADMVKSRGYLYLPLEHNLGYGAAINAAVQILDPGIEWLAVGNPDVEIAPGAIDRLVSRAESDPRIAIVGPQIVNSDGSVYPSARAIPSLGNGIGHALFANLWPSNPWSREYHNDFATYSEARTAGWLSGAFFVARRSAFSEVGGFDEHFFMYFEDVDLGFRLGKAGWVSFYDPSAKVVHAGGHSTASNAIAMTKEHHASARKFLSRIYPGRRLWPLRVALFFGLKLRVVLIRLRSSKRPTPVH